MSGRAALLCCLVAGAAHAEGALPGGPALDAEGFDRITLGTRMETYDPDQPYGVEEFLPGHRTIWKDAGGCVRSTWQAVGGQICFRYETHPETPVCWVYNWHEGALWGWYQGRGDGLRVRLLPGARALNCDWLGS